MKIKPLGQPYQGTTVRCSECQIVMAGVKYPKPGYKNICFGCKDKLRFNPRITTPNILMKKK
jgi:hypothetical protein